MALGATDQHSQNQPYFEDQTISFFFSYKQSHLKIPFLFLLMRESPISSIRILRTFNARAGRNWAGALQKVDRPHNAISMSDISEKY